MIKEMNFKFLYFCLWFGLVKSIDIVSMEGPVNKRSVDEVIYEFHTNAEENDWIFYLNTPGGSVMEGARLLPYLETKNVTCVVDKAYSMGFLLLQACSKRFMLPYGSIMQHDMYMGLEDDYTKIKSYMAFLTKVYDRLTTMQYTRIGLSKGEYLRKIKDNWWLTAEEAVQENCADDIIERMDIILQ